MSWRYFFLPFTFPIPERVGDDKGDVCSGEASDPVMDSLSLPFPEPGGCRGGVVTIGL